MGYNMIIYYAALQAIPSELEEASLMDGATASGTRSTSSCR